MYCKSCGTQISEGVKFCPNCGKEAGNQHPVGQVQGKTGDKSRIAAGLLGILIGGLGIHNFYLGYTGKAVAQLLLTVTVFFAFVSWIWGLIEGIIILTNKEYRDADGNLLQD